MARSYFISRWHHQMETFSALLALSPVGEFPHEGQWRGALRFSLICVWTNGWVNNRDVGDLKRHRPHYDVTIMSHGTFQSTCTKCEVNPPVNGGSTYKVLVMRNFDIFFIDCLNEQLSWLPVIWDVTTLVLLHCNVLRPWWPYYQTQ